MVAFAPCRVLSTGFLGESHPAPPRCQFCLDLRFGGAFGSTRLGRRDLWFDGTFQTLHLLPRRTFVPDFVLRHLRPTPFK